MIIARVLICCSLICFSFLLSFNCFAGYKEELTCMTHAIFMEANAEPEEGQIAVAHVIMNRVKDKKFPNTICSVVNHQHFSYKDKKNLYRKKLSSIAHKVITKQIKDNTNGATHYHSVKVKPHWSDQYEFMMVIGNHVFYKYRYGKNLPQPES